MWELSQVFQKPGSPSSFCWGKEILALIFLSWKQKSTGTTKTMLKELVKHS